MEVAYAIVEPYAFNVLTFQCRTHEAAAMAGVVDVVFQPAYHAAVEDAAREDGFAAVDAADEATIVIASKEDIVAG